MTDFAAQNVHREIVLEQHLVSHRSGTTRVSPTYFRVGTVLTTVNDAARPAAPVAYGHH